MPPYAFRKGPQFSGANRGEQFEAAFDQPLNGPSTFAQGLVGGALDSFGLGTVIRDFSIPQGAEVPQDPNAPWQPPRIGPDAAAGAIYGGIRDFFNPKSDEPAMTADEWKASPFYREHIPYDASMTADRAAALAIWDDAKQVREHFASKSPITSFFGNLAGQAFDPINYIPIAGPAVKAGAVAKFGIMGGAIATGALDAAANTAVAGVLTAGARAQYGDDVSWQHQISEVATAALIGAAFGGVGGFFEGRRASAALVRAEADAATLRTTQEARLALNGGIRGLALEDGVNLLPNEIEPVARRAAEYQQPLPLEAPDTPRSVVTPTGVRVQVQPEIVDATTLTAASGDLQPRDRSRDASAAQIEDIAINLDPGRLQFSPEADRGAPIVGPDGVVESGNGRRQAIIRAAEAYPERFEAYKQALREAGYTVPDEGVPMLVSRRVSDMSPEQRVDFVNGANTSAIARMSATEAAMTDVRAMTDNVIGAYAGGDVKAAGNREFVRGFLGNLPQNERAGLVDANGTLNADGVRRIENSLVAAAYGDPGIVARFAEATDDNAKSITGAMSDAAADWARMRRNIEAGEIGRDMDLTPNVLAALRLISRAREQAALQGRPVSQLVDEAVRQIDLVDGALDPRTEAIVQIFYGEGFRRSKSRDDIATALRAIVGEVEASGRPQLFADTVVSGIDIARSVANRGAAQGDLLNVGTGNVGNRSSAAQGVPANGEFGVQGPGRRDQGAAHGATRAAAPRAVDSSPGRQPQPPEGRDAAAGAVGRPDDSKALAAQYGVDPKSGAFVEQTDIDQLMGQGRISEADEAELAAADENFERANSYGQALMTAARCMVA